MSLRPVIFLSAVSKELQTARQSAANTLTALGYTPDHQDIFPTDSGQLLAMLRRKVDAASAVVQIVGQSYGAEPDTPTPEFGRVSYTQYEALYALHRKKPVHYLFTGPGFPADPHEPEPDELRDLQAAYIKTIRASGDLRHPVSTAADLENKIHRLRDDLARLRRRTLQWAVLSTAAVLAIAGGVTWLIFRDKQHSQSVATLNTNVEKVLQRDALLLQVLRDYPAALAASATFDKSQSESSRLAAAYRNLEEKHKLPPGSLAKDLPVFAMQLLLREDTSKLDRANALLVQKKFAEAESTALQAKDEALRTAPEVASRAIQALATAGGAAQAQIRYPRALDHFKAAAALTEQARDPAEWARVQCAIANVLTDLGRAREVEVILRTVLAVRERIPGPEHPDTLRARNNLVTALWAQGKAADAETEARLVLAAMAHVLGREHPDTLRIWSNLSLTLRAQEKNAAADREDQERIAIEERVLGPDHPDTLASWNNRALALQGLGKYAEAEAGHRAVTEARGRLLGPDHPDTLASRHNLANVLEARGEHAAAFTERQEVRDIAERMLGPDHPVTLMSRTNLAISLLEQGKNAEAEAEHRAVLAVRQHVLGPEHQQTLTGRINLANTLMALKKYPQAEAEYREVHGLLEKVQGAEHSVTLTTRSNLAIALQAQGKYEEAVAEHSAVLAVRQRVLKPGHPEFLSSHYNVALCLKAQAEAKTAQQDHPAAQRLWADALDHAREAQHGGESTLEANHSQQILYTKFVKYLQTKLSNLPPEK